MTNFFLSTPPPDCQAIDFRKECSVRSTALVQVPVHEQAPTTPPAGPIEIHPQAPPIPGADTGPLAHLDGWQLPEFTAAGALDALSVAGVFTGSVAAVTTAALAASWLWTWSPIRLRNFGIGACALPGSALFIDGYSGPTEAMGRAVTEIATGLPLQGAVTAAIATVPVGWFSAAIWLALRNDRRDTRGLKSPTRTERAMWARRQREMAAATRMAANALPLCCGTVSPQPVIGRAASTTSTAPARSVLGQMRGRHQSLFTVPWLAMREHYVTVGNPGSGKTTKMDRTILSFWATAWRMHQQWWRAAKVGRPLAIIIDVKGARDARRNARKLRAAFERLGMPAPRIAIWPDDGELNSDGTKRNPMAFAFFDGTARELITRLEGLIGAGMATDNVDPAEAYYLQMRKAILHLVVDAPNPAKGLDAGQDPPRGFLEYLERMDRAELVRRWAGHPDELAAITAVTTSQRNPILAAERTAMMNLARELGEEFEGTARLTDYDVVYCCLEGITSPLLAQAQFGALVAMLTMLAGTDHGRTIQLFCDEFAQVCGDSGAARIVELLRSAGIGSGWYAQSWMGLGKDDDQRHRLVDACSGGIFAMRSNFAGPLAEKLGTGRKSAYSQKVTGGRFGDEGNVQPEDRFLASPAVMADFGPGDIVHVRAGRATFGHISELDIETLRPLPGLAESTPSPAAPVAALKKAA